MATTSHICRLRKRVTIDQELSACSAHAHTPPPTIGRQCARTLHGDEYEKRPLPDRHPPHPLPRWYWGDGHPNSDWPRSDITLYLPVGACGRTSRREVGCGVGVSGVGVGHCPKGRFEIKLRHDDRWGTSRCQRETCGLASARGHHHTHLDHARCDDTGSECIPPPFGRTRDQAPLLGMARGVMAKKSVQKL
jgi:hypothetical protein